MSWVASSSGRIDCGGYVARDPDPADRRRNVITVTGVGRERAAELGRRVRASRTSSWNRSTTTRDGSSPRCCASFSTITDKGFPRCPPTSRTFMLVE
jgi:DNA-binding MarR family transcriptional regulator